MTQNEVAFLSYGSVLEIIEEIPTAVRVIRRVRRITQAQVGEECGIAEATVRKIEEGNVDLRLSTLRCILRWLSSQSEDSFYRKL